MNYIALVGLGNMGSKYLNLLSKSYDNLILCDTDESKLKDKGFLYVKDIKDIDKPISKAIIATDPSKHVELAGKLLSIGADVLIEKPPASSYDELSTLSIYKDKIWISEIERFSICIKELPKHIKPKSIHIKRLNKGKGYINPIWDLAWHDLYNLLYLFGDVDIKNFNTGHIWKLEGMVNKDIPFSLEVAWNHHFVDRSWHINTKNGSIYMNFADEEIILEDGSSYNRRDGNKLLDMIGQFLDGMSDNSFDRAMKILKLLDGLEV